MGSILFGIVEFLAKLPERDIAKVCTTLKISESKIFKDTIAKKGCSKAPYTEALTEILTSSNRGMLSSLYKSIEGVLFVGGCAPGVGIAFNIVDACFCIALGNWFGAFISIISCFPIPGFKVAGKGIEKILVSVLAKISPTDMSRIFKMLRVHLPKIGFHTDDCYIKIGNYLEATIAELKNPFASETIKILASAVRKMCKNNIDNVGASGTSAVFGKYTIKAEHREYKLLSVTNKGITNHGIK